MILFCFCTFLRGCRGPRLALIMPIPPLHPRNVSVVGKAGDGREEGVGRWWLGLVGRRRGRNWAGEGGMVTGLGEGRDAHPSGAYGGHLQTCQIQIHNSVRGR